MQTANWRATARLRDLVDVALAFELFLPDAMRFIPVQFCEAHPTIPQPDLGHALHLPPTADAIQAAQPLKLSDSSADGDCFDVGEIAKDVEINPGAILACPRAVRKLDPSRYAASRS